MLDTNEIRAQMARRRYNITKLAREMGICPKTLSDRLSKCPGKFTYEEMESLIYILKIDEPDKIFFVKPILRKLDKTEVHTHPKV